MKILTIFTLTIVLVLAVWFVIEVDIWVGASLNLIFQFLFISLGIGVAWASFVVQRHWATLVAPSLYVLFILLLPFISFSAVKPALRGLEKINPGMTESQVRAVFNQHFPENGRFKRPEFRQIPENQLCFVVDPTDGCCDTATIHIKFANGKSVSGEFRAD
jgi:hypothetical protein